MKAADLHEAQQIMSRIREIDGLGLRTVKSIMLTTVGERGGESGAWFSKQALPVIEKLWRDGLAAERAALIRRANQIGLTI